MFSQGVNLSSKLGSSLGPDTSEHRLKPYYKTQNRTKRFNKLTNQNCFGTRGSEVQIHSLRHSFFPRIKVAYAAVFIFGLRVLVQERMNMAARILHSCGNFLCIEVAFSYKRGSSSQLFCSYSSRKDPRSRLPACLHFPLPFLTVIISTRGSEVTQQSST